MKERRVQAVYEAIDHMAWQAGSGCSGNGQHVASM